MWLIFEELFSLAECWVWPPSCDNKLNVVYLFRLPWLGQENRLLYYYPVLVIQTRLCKLWFSRICLVHPVAQSFWPAKKSFLLIVFVNTFLCFNAYCTPFPSCLNYTAFFPPLLSCKKVLDSLFVHKTKQSTTVFSYAIFVFLFNFKLPFAFFPYCTLDLTHLWKPLVANFLYLYKVTI